MLAAAAVSMVTVAAPAVDAADNSTLEEITVTAQRRVENLQDVPIAATVLTGDMLANKGVNNIVELQYAAPGFTVADYGSANVLNIRGIGRSAVDVELPSGVVLYRDGFPTFPGYFQNEPYYDIASVEVLRGPQGTFAGKSAAGGAVLIRSASPDLSGVSGKVEGEVGNKEYFGATGVINIPASDTVAFRAALHHEERGEPLVDSISGPYVGRPGQPRLTSLRLGALWKPSDQLSAEVKLDASDLDFGGNITGSYGTDLYNPVQDANFDYRDRSWRTVANVKYNFANDLTLSSVTGWQRVHTVNNFDRNGGQLPLDRFDSQGLFKLYSQEFNLISPETDSGFSYIVGVFAQRTDSVIFNFRKLGFNIYQIPGEFYPVIGFNRDYLKREDEYSGFVDFKYEFTENWEAELGARYSRYKNTSDIDVVAQVAPGQPPNFSITTVPHPTGTENDVDAKLSLTYKIAPESNLYAIVARAHVNGGFNIVSGLPFDPQEVISYEMGWKHSWVDGRVRTQLGAYHQTVSNFQAQFADIALPSQNVLQNADGKSKLQGVEASMQVRLGGFGFDFAATYLDSELGDFPDVFVNPPAPFTPYTTNLSGGEAPFAPEFSLNVGASYDFSLSSAFTLTPRVDVAYVSDQNGAVFGEVFTRIPSRTLINASLRLEADAWFGEFYGTNVTDKRYVAGIQDLGNIWYPGAPRQYGLRVGYNF